MYVQRERDARKPPFNSPKGVGRYKVLFIYGEFLGADPGRAVPCVGKPSCALPCGACARALTPLPSAGVSVTDASSGIAEVK